MDGAPEILEDTSETLSPLGEKVAPVLFVLFIAGMAYLLYRDVMLAVRAFGLVIAVAGLLATLLAARAIARARRSPHWPVVDAAVTKSEVFTSTSSSRGSNQSVSTTMHEYYPAVWYEYEVQGRRYRSKRLIFLRTNYARSDAEEAVARYPVGAQVTAYYVAANPKIAVLEPGLGPNAGHYYKGLAIGAAFLAIGLFVMFAVPRLISALG